MSNAVGWFEIYVQDINRATSLYEAAFGAPPRRPQSPAIQMQAFPMDREGHGSPRALVHMRGFPSGKNSVLVYFMCDDAAVQEAKAAASGGKIEKKKFSIGQYGFMSLVYDTEGNMIGLHSMK